MSIYKVTGYVMTPEVAMTRYIEADDPKEAVAEYCDEDWTPGNVTADEMPSDDKSARHKMLERQTIVTVTVGEVEL